MSTASLACVSKWNRNEGSQTITVWLKAAELNSKMSQHPTALLSRYASINPLGSTPIRIAIRSILFVDLTESDQQLATYVCVFIKTSLLKVWNLYTFHRLALQPVLTVWYSFPIFSFLKKSKHFVLLKPMRVTWYISVQSFLLHTWILCWKIYFLD